MRASVLLVLLLACDGGAKQQAPVPCAPAAVAAHGVVAAPHGVPPVAPAADIDLAVHMKRTRCFGSCPAYTVDIGRDGAVKFAGDAFTVAKQATGHISAERMRAIGELIDAAHFYSLRDKYVSAGCTSVSTDSPTVFIEVVRAGKKKRIERYYGCDGAPMALDELSEAIDLAAGTAEWIGPPKR